MAREIKTDNDFENYFRDLYAIENIQEEEIQEWYQSYCYKGFDRKKVIQELRRKVPDIKIAQQIIMICGLLGPQRAAQVKLINGKTIASYGIPASGMKGNEGVSCQRITAATADLCAYFLKKTNVPKRLNLPCPAWLQFPSAGSIILSEPLREMHLEFSRRFSTVIGGVFNEQIYLQMMTNAYLDPKLRLFDEKISIETDIRSSASSSAVPPPAVSVNPSVQFAPTSVVNQSHVAKRT